MALRRLGYIMSEGFSSTHDSSDHRTARKGHDYSVALADFRLRVLQRGHELYRDLPWRHTRDPYAVWISEVMLQQTQVSRVDGRWQRWMFHFPSLEILAKAESAEVLEEWQGLGYNRRAIALHRAAKALLEAGAAFPRETHALVALPGIGPATAAGIRAFAYNLHAVYLETNVRTVYLHELYPDAVRVPDSELIPLVEDACPQDASDPNDDPRTWYYALLDYGAYLKRTVPNPSRRSATHVRQSRFEGSHRQKRALVLRLLLNAPDGISVDAVAHALSDEELKAGRPPVSTEMTAALLRELSAEGFCSERDSIWTA